MLSYDINCIFPHFRYKNVFARLVIHGFNDSRDSRLGVEFAGRYVCLRILF